MAFYSNPKIVTDGLVLALDAGSENSYPGSGTTWTDLIDNSTYTASNASIGTATPGVMTLNGTSDYIQLPDTSDLEFGTNPITIDFWFNGGTQSTSYPAIISNMSWSVGGDGFAIRYDNTNQDNRITLTWREMGDPFIRSDALTHNTWYYVTLVRDGTTISFYINGDLHDSDTISVDKIIDLTYGGGARIGHGSWDNANGYFAGSVAVPRIYKNKALSTTEITQNFNAQRSRFGV